MIIRFGTVQALFFFTAGVVFIIFFAGVPHCRSAGAAARRHLRAVRLGFWRPVPSDKTFVQVPSYLVAPIRTMSEALEVHHELDRVAGVHHHFLADAVLATRRNVGEESFEYAMALNKSQPRETWLFRSRGGHRHCSTWLRWS